jgi:hypothetical protein
MSRKLQRNLDRLRIAQLPGILLKRGAQILSQSDSIADGMTAIKLGDTAPPGMMHATSYDILEIRHHRKRPMVDPGL